ncbi:MAG: phosphoglucomutase/phosphomannomutase family protein, partial [Candidatus Omnitrophica bacterium]|nr:phosphoglucomutase/phosphomannomutase family protein [Candidatus Omnitrophota bacterium]
ADRIAAMRPDGRYITPSEIIALLALHLVEDRKWRGSIVKTVSCSVLIDRIAGKLGLKVCETPIGFKHICKLMREEDVLIGGEESGGIGVKNYIPERDGVLLALLLLEMMADRNTGILQIMDQMEKRYGRFHYLREDIHFEGGTQRKNEILETLKNSPPNNLLGKKITQTKTFDGVKFICEDDSWLLLRFSGTESLLRVYAESDSLKFARELIGYGRKLVNS